MIERNQVVPFSPVFAANSLLKTITRLHCDAIDV